MTEPKDFYSPSEIRFTRNQCIWIIIHLDSLQRGLYPSDHKITGYTGKKKGGINKRAYFDNPVVISAEVTRRLKLTKTDGKLLKAQVQGGITDYDMLEPEAQMALNYISLWDFRRRPKYFQWRKDRIYNQRKGRIKLR